MSYKARIQDRYANRQREVQVYATEQPQLEANLASQLIEKWGLVAAIEDGEDAAGRQKLRQLTPTEIVERACDTAGLAVAEYRKRGWMLELPDLAEINADFEGE